MFARKSPPRARTFVGGGGLVVSGSSDPNRQAQLERGDLLLTLENVVKCLINLAASGKGIVLGDSHRETLELCTAIYRIFTHSLLLDTSLPPQARLAHVWEYIHAHEENFPVPLVVTVVKLEHVHTSHGQLKALIRLALNQGKMHLVLENLHRTTLRDPRHIYSQQSFMFSSNAVGEGVRILESLTLPPSRVTFAFAVDHFVLDKEPSAAPKAPATPTAPVPMSNADIDVSDKKVKKTKPKKPPTKDETESLGLAKEQSDSQTELIDTTPSSSLPSNLSNQFAEQMILSESPRSFDDRQMRDTRNDTPVKGTALVVEVVGVPEKQPKVEVSQPKKQLSNTESAVGSVNAKSIEQEVVPSVANPALLGSSPSLMVQHSSPTRFVSSPPEIDHSANIFNTFKSKSQSSQSIRTSAAPDISKPQLSATVSSPVLAVQQQPASPARTKAAPKKPEKTKSTKILSRLAVAAARRVGRSCARRGLRHGYKRAMRNSSIGATSSRVLVIPRPRKTNFSTTPKAPDSGNMWHREMVDDAVQSIFSSALVRFGIFHLLGGPCRLVTLNQHKWWRKLILARREKWDWATKHHSHKLSATVVFRFEGRPMKKRESMIQSTNSTQGAAKGKVKSAVSSNHHLKLHYEFHMDFTINPDIPIECSNCNRSILGAESRFCEYTGQHFCSNCHANDERALPSLIVKNWDFSSRKVCLLAKEYLDEIWNMPCIDMRQARPRILANATVKKLMEYREIISIQKEFVVTCRETQVAELIGWAGPHMFLLATEPHMFTLKSLVLAYQGTFLNTLRDLISRYTNHITHCEICHAKGSFCEALTNRTCSIAKEEVIFPFQISSTCRCPTCKALFHKECFRGIDLCPRCTRARTKPKSK
eukprot:c3653_g1_i1.p1 GENE.c3653_g1_i1~~c3653_g1_i1.p1  ORF type:complete len:876 (+),score=136.04 c3653_g1_i1:43-2670(+)